MCPDKNILPSSKGCENLHNILKSPIRMIVINVAELPHNFWSFLAPFKQLLEVFNPFQNFSYEIDNERR